MIYLDNAATTLTKPAAVARSAGWAVGHLTIPGRGEYLPSKRAAEYAFNCRTRAAELFNVSSPENIVLTSSATHGLNIAIKSLVSPGSRVLISGYEHNAVTRPLHAVGANVAVAASELFEPEMAVFAFESRLTKDTRLVVCTHVSNVFGYVLPVERIAQLCRERGIPFVLDASQSAGVIRIDAESLGAAFIAMPGHKGLYGPQGTGILICASPARTLMEGGTGSRSAAADMPDYLPDRLEAGTHNMPGIAGLYSGMEFILKRGADRILEHERDLTEYAADRLIMLDRLRLYRSEYPDFQAGLLSFTSDALTAGAIGEELAKRGVAVRTGLHCAPLAHRTAGTFKTGTVRVSVSAFSTKKEMRQFTDAMEDVLRGA